MTTDIKTIKPISPEEAMAQAGSRHPSAVIESFNELIVENLQGAGGRITAKILQNDIVERIMSKMEGVKRNAIFESNWLEVEQLFANEGWKVVYDAPGFNETYQASFTFSKKRSD